MDDRIVNYDYTPEVSTAKEGKILCLVATPVCLDRNQNNHRLATIPQRTHFRFKGQLDLDGTSFSLIRVRVQNASSLPFLVETVDSKIWSFPTCTWSDAQNLVEFCAGMGAMGQGALARQFHPVVACELRERMADMYRLNSPAVVIDGDLTYIETLDRVYKAHPRSASMAAGISCQPYSVLGDQRSGMDDRSSTLPGTLAGAHFLRSLVVILECVEPAGSDAFVKWHIDRFCERTGFHQAVTTLRLSDVWPCKRNRWWCVLTAPALGRMELPVFPTLLDLPSIRHIMPEILPWSRDFETKLKLTPIEIEAFKDTQGSAQQYMINLKGVLPCALHAWGSQLGACPCGCRTGALSQSRLSAKGLFGVLARCITLESMTTDDQVILRQLDPMLEWGNDPRLTLGAIGQLASPIQAVWIFTHVLKKLQETQFGSSQVIPQSVLQAYRSWLLARSLPMSPFKPNFPLNSEALERAQQWHKHETPCENMMTLAATKKTIDQLFDELVTEGRLVSLDVLRNEEVQQIQQVDISSPCSVFVSDWDLVPTSPVSSVLPSENDSRDQVQVHLCISRNGQAETPTVFKTLKGTKVQQIVETECKFSGIDLDDIVGCCIEGNFVDASTMIQSNVTLNLHVKVKATAVGPTVVSPDAIGMEYDQNIPLCQVKSDGLLKLIPPKIKLISQCEALCAQTIRSSDREAILENQQFIWADDEIRWHQKRLCDSWNEHASCPVKPCHLDPIVAYGWATAGGDVTGEVSKWYTAQGCPKCILIVLWQEGHWAPVLLDVESSSLEVIRTPRHSQVEDLVDQLVQVFRAATGIVAGDEHISSIHQVKNGCGAASIAFLEHMVFQQDLPSNDSEAIDRHYSYRSAFVTAIREKFLTQNPWMWGAGVSDTTKAIDLIKPFLAQHGVESDQLLPRAQATVKLLGAEEVIKATQGKAPWRTLKYLANNVRHQLILPDELQKQIEKKAGGEAVGKPQRKNRSQRNEKQEEPIALDPSKLQIPDDIFQHDNLPLKQLAAHQIGPLARGFVVVTHTEAEPFIRANQIVSKEPLALLILNAPSANWVTTLPYQRVTAPARCVVNNEPILIEATMVQIGQGTVEKASVSSHAKIATVDVSTLKLVVYKDEVVISWDSFVAGPVKYIISQIPLLRLCGETSCQCGAWHNEESCGVSASIVDVWRRQFLREGFRPEVPKAATIFTVCFRVPKCIRDRIIACGGTGGVYAEPRTLDAKEIDRSFDVVWIPRSDKTSVMHLKQTNPAVLSIARLGDRWGLRVPASQAQEVHQQIRPEAVYLEQGPRCHFHAGPIPYGTDRQALCRAFKAFGWEAKPIQPVGSVDGGRGNTWHVVSTKPPDSNILVMGHGEVVISTMKSPDNHRMDTMKPVANGTTLSLCGTGNPNAKGKDPWLVRDPWQAPPVKPDSVAPGVSEADRGLKQLEDKIEQAVLAKMPQHTSMEQDDMPDRVAVLEKQVSSLMVKQSSMETTIQDQHVQQAAQLSQLQGQINAQGQQFAGQLESQHQQIQHMFDSQMSQIRSLLAKRPREDGE